MEMVLDKQVVEDVVLTINQAVGPMEKGVTKIQETFHLKKTDSDDDHEESELEVEKHVEQHLSENDSHPELQV